ncbi:SMP-30/gluconolactonase/LRE family protein [Nocardia tengchongensis]|uniref:SMP-30/gluconolactonase/LRE family protein n=1 Tax=Nocardia tengchongensis TaxID=2055889 RepID=UPI00367FA0A4
MPTQIEAARWVTGFSWTECPRWHDGRFYFTDLFSARVVAVAPDGTAETVIDLSQRPTANGERVVTAGIGHLPDGRLVVNSMYEQLVLVHDGNTLSVHADLTGLATSPINDMVVDASGRIYITQLGFDVFAGETPKESPLLVVEPDGTARVADEAGMCMGANGIAISADGSTLVTAETYISRITAFDIAPDGKLNGRRLFADVGPDAYPDGMCLDQDGAVWTALAAQGRVIRVLDGGEVTHEIRPPATKAGITTACGLGGDDRRTLYLCCGFEVMDFDKSIREGRGSIWTTNVPVGGGTACP